MEQNFVNQGVHRIDRWVKYVATRTWIRTGIFVVAFLETTISPLLPELVVAAVLSYRKDISWKLLSIISAAGSAFGGYPPERPSYPAPARASAAKLSRPSFLLLTPLPHSTILLCNIAVNRRGNRYGSCVGRPEPGEERHA